MADEDTPPKVFISYSWSNPDHMSWVMSLVEELANNGVQPVIDRLDLQPGQEANRFMERLVNDPDITKVIMICDRQYVDKSDNRLGGAGTEAQIITPQIYASAEESKFVAVIRDRYDDGRPYVPAYYGSRIYIDMSDPSTYADSLDQLVRWIWGQPQYKRPAIAGKPKFLSDDSAPQRALSSTSLRRVVDAVKTRANTAASELGTGLHELTEKLESFRVSYDPGNPDGFDDKAVAAIDSSASWRNDYIQIVIAIAQYDPSEENVQKLHRFLEGLLPFTDRMPHTQTSSNVDYDTFRFLALEVVLYTLAAFIKYERFQQATAFFEDSYYWEHPSGRANNTHDISEFNHFLKTMDIRNTRLKLNRVSVTADLLHARNKGTGIEYRHVMVADFIIYLRSVADNHVGHWYPQTLVYVDGYGGAFEPFARAKSRKYFRKLAPILGVKEADEVRAIVGKVETDEQYRPRYGWNRLDVARLSGASELAMNP